MTSIYKKIISIILICAVAVATGLSVGKIYLDMNTAPTGLSDMDTVYKASEEEVVALYNRSNGARVADFNAIELWQIAEYKLSLQDKFQREMTGVVTSGGMGIMVDVPMRSIKIKNGNILTYDKLSPTKNTAGIDTPNICSKITYNYKTSNQANINTSGVFLDKNAASEKLSATFSGAGQNYTKEEYEKIFHTMPNRSIMPYVISNKTCDTTNISIVTDNGDGTYSFEISLTGENLEKAAVYYSWEIYFSTCKNVYIATDGTVVYENGYSLPEWKTAKINITIDSNFMFKSVTYKENYTIYNAPVLGRADVIDNFVDQFVYGDEVLNA